MKSQKGKRVAILVDDNSKGNSTTPPPRQQQQQQSTGKSAIRAESPPNSGEFRVGIWGGDFSEEQHDDKSGGSSNRQQQQQQQQQQSPTPPTFGSGPLSASSSAAASSQQRYRRRTTVLRVSKGSTGDFSLPGDARRRESGDEQQHGASVLSRPMLGSDFVNLDDGDAKKEKQSERQEEPVPDEEECSEKTKEETERDSAVTATATTKDHLASTMAVPSGSQRRGSLMVRRGRASSLTATSSAQPTTRNKQQQQQQQDEGPGTARATIPKDDQEEEEKDAGGKRAPPAALNQSQLVQQDSQQQQQLQRRLTTTTPSSPAPTPASATAAPTPPSTAAKQQQQQHLSATQDHPTSLPQELLVLLMQFRGAVESVASDPNIMAASADTAQTTKELHQSCNAIIRYISNYLVRKFSEEQEEARRKALGWKMQNIGENGEILGHGDEEAAGKQGVREEGGEKEEDEEEEGPLKKQKGKKKANANIKINVNEDRGDVETRKNTKPDILGPFAIQTLYGLMESMLHTLQADRATLFLFDAVNNELVGIVAVGAKGVIRPIRIPASHGVAGAVFRTGLGINVENTEKCPDSLFSRDVDKKTGYFTRSMLCFPLRRPNAMLSTQQELQGQQQEEQQQEDGGGGTSGDDSERQQRASVSSRRRDSGGSSLSTSHRRSSAANNNTSNSATSPGREGVDRRRRRAAEDSEGKLFGVVQVLNKMRTHTGTASGAALSARVQAHAAALLPKSLMENIASPLASASGASGATTRPASGAAAAPSGFVVHAPTTEGFDHEDESALHHYCRLIASLLHWSAGAIDHTGMRAEEESRKLQAFVQAHRHCFSHKRTNTDAGTRRLTIAEARHQHERQRKLEEKLSEARLRKLDEMMKLYGPGSSIGDGPTLVYRAGSSSSQQQQQQQSPNAGGGGGSDRDVRDVALVMRRIEASWKTLRATCMQQHERIRELEEQLEAAQHAFRGLHATCVRCGITYDREMLKQQQHHHGDGDGSSFVTQQKAPVLGSAGGVTLVVDDSRSQGTQNDARVEKKQSATLMKQPQSLKKSDANDDDGGEEDDEQFAAKLKKFEQNVLYRKSTQSVQETQAYQARLSASNRPFDSDIDLVKAQRAARLMATHQTPVKSPKALLPLSPEERRRRQAVNEDKVWEKRARSPLRGFLDAPASLQQHAHATLFHERHEVEERRKGYVNKRLEGLVSAHNQEKEELERRQNAQRQELFASIIHEDAAYAEALGKAFFAAQGEQNPTPRMTYRPVLDELCGIGSGDKTTKK